ncbi:MAG TPA: hypothetical protein VFV37_09100 [Luteibaculaceae bacterium]|nr:hypothetical protein [Luteibaculaceae bacterium]
MEQLTAAAYVETEICLFGFDDDNYNEELEAAVSADIIKRKLTRIRLLIGSLGLSTNTAVNLCEVTPAEWAELRALVLN